MDINELKEQFGGTKLSDDVLEKLGYDLCESKISLWKDPHYKIELRMDKRNNCYYNQDYQNQRINVYTIYDLIDLYEKLNARNVLLNYNWCNLK